MGLVLLLAAPLLLSVAPRSFMAHDEGFYALQARWMVESGDWLTPVVWGEPIYDRTVGVSWLIAASTTLFGPHRWAVYLPNTACAIAAAALTWRLSRRWVAAAVLVLTPLWFSYAHLATQDMPLLALELVGLWGIWTRRPVAAGLWLGLAFLIKGWMALLPALAMAPLLLLERRTLVRDWRFWAALVAGWLPALLWIERSIARYGLDTVSLLWRKLFWLSGGTVFAQGPLYYLWNVPANTAPWGLIAPLGWLLLWRRWRRGELQREALLLWLAYPAVLLLLLSAFKTKTPYYSLQLTPFIAMAAGTAIDWAAQTSGTLWKRLRLVPMLPGATLLAAGLLAPLPDLGTIPPLALRTAAIALGSCWLASGWPSGLLRRQQLWLLGPYLALAVLLQVGVFIDHSPATRLRLADPQVAAVMRSGRVHYQGKWPMDDQAQKELMVLALGTPQLGPMHRRVETIPPGVPVWQQRGNSWTLHPSWTQP